MNAPVARNAGVDMEPGSLTADALDDLVRDLIVKVLGVDLSEVTPDARFFNDLNGESIDMLDLQFHLQKLFKIQLDLLKQFSHSISTDDAGVVTPESLRQLAINYPFLPIPRLPASPTTEDLKQLLTVHAITRLVELQLVDGEDTGTVGASE